MGKCRAELLHNTLIWFSLPFYHRAIHIRSTNVNLACQTLGNNRKKFVNIYKRKPSRRDVHYFCHLMSNLVIWQLNWREEEDEEGSLIFCLFSNALHRSTSAENKVLFITFLMSSIWYLSFLRRDWMKLKSKATDLSWCDYWLWLGEIPHKICEFKVCIWVIEMEGVVWMLLATVECSFL